MQITRTYDARVENGQVFFAGGEGRDGEGAVGLSAAADPPLCGRTRTFGCF